MELSNKWTIYFHDYENPDWSHESYERLVVLETPTDFWTVFEMMKQKLTTGMFFFMKNKIFPKWDSHVNEGTKYTFMSIKILKVRVEGFAEHMLVRLLSETLHKNNPNCVKGISISPKKHFCIFKVWLSSDDDSQSYNERDFDIPDNCFHGSIIFRES